MSTKLFEQLALYAIYTTRDDCGRTAELTPTDWVEQVLDLGIRCVQIRDTDQSLSPNLLRVLVRRCEKQGALCLINNHVDLAAEVAAHGVHLGQDDMPVARAREYSQQWIIGASARTRAAAQAAFLAGADYLGIGPVFATDTKSVDVAPLGWEGFDDVADQTPLPAVAIGGLRAEHVAQARRNSERYTGLAFGSALATSTGIAHFREITGGARA